MPFTDFVEERFFSPCTQWLEDEAQGRSASGEYNKPAGTLSKINISGGREVTTKGRNECIVKIRGVNDRNAAEALLGRRMYVLASERPSLREADVGDGDDDFYAQELQGLRVVLKEGGDEVGKVIDVFRGAGTHDLLKVEVPPLPGSDADDENAAGDGEKRKTKSPGEFVYVPFVKDIVPTVDVPNGFLEITPPPGLLDLRQRASKPKKQRVVAPPPKKKST
jgi:16S rRNA processing protein RimM